MSIQQITSDFSVTGQISLEDIPTFKDQGFATIICNRPETEDGALASAEIAAKAETAGMAFHYIPVISNAITEADIAAMAEVLKSATPPFLAYCRSGVRSKRMFELASTHISKAKPASSSHSGHSKRVVIVGGGAAGIAVASSLFERNAAIDVTIVDPADVHFYQPGWTMVGGGVFTAEETVETMASQIPAGATWIKQPVTTFQPEKNEISLGDGRKLGYDQLIVCPGLKLDWDAVDGLTATLGQHGVTSNYRFDLAPYTWELVQGMGSGTALFTQPPMPIKCAGAPQKAMYLSADHWHRAGRLDQINIEFCNAGGVLFGVKDYVPALMEYVEKYNAQLNFNMNLKAVDGPARKALFTLTDADGKTGDVEKSFDMMHVCPPQTAPDFIKNSPLADAAGWVDVNPSTLRHQKYENIWGLGDATNTPNAKTAAAIRKQAPIVAENLLAVLAGKPAPFAYSGYGSCPLTVERGKIVLAEFAYGGALEPTFPAWLFNGTRPNRAAWFLKEKILPRLYWNGMLKGKEWMAKPRSRTSEI